MELHAYSILLALFSSFSKLLLQQQETTVRVVISVRNVYVLGDTYWDLAICSVAIRRQGTMTDCTQVPPLSSIDRD